jgi:hypothetical protein
MTDLVGGVVLRATSRLSHEPPAAKSVTVAVVSRAERLRTIMNQIFHGCAEFQPRGFFSTACEADRLIPKETQLLLIEMPLQDACGIRFGREFLVVAPVRE